MSKNDSAAPKAVSININGETKNGQTMLFSDVALEKVFSTGSKGYYIGGKMTNPESGEKYQISCNITLIGSKPDK